MNPHPFMGMQCEEESPQQYVDIHFSSLSALLSAALPTATPPPNSAMNELHAGPVGTDKDQPLREDIRLLGRLLGDTLREQEGAALFERVEEIRQSALRFRREGDLGAKAALEGLLDGLDHDAANRVVRAFSFFSQLANIAEDLHHNRRRRAHQIAGSPPQAGSIAFALARVEAAGAGREAL